MDFSKLDQKTRDDSLKKDLSIEKIKILEKYGLISSKDLYWVSVKENARKQVFFKHEFLIKTDLISILFRINGLCMGKVKYFRTYLDNFEPYAYHFEKGFIKTELWNADFLMHKKSGLYIDLRFLDKIRQMEDFNEFCNYLENYKKNKVKC